MVMVVVFGIIAVIVRTQFEEMAEGRKEEEQDFE